MQCQIINAFESRDYKLLEFKSWGVLEVKLKTIAAMNVTSTVTYLQ